MQNIGNPFLIGIYYSECKEPENANEYLREFVQDFIAIECQGLMFDSDNNLQLWNEENEETKIQLILGNIYADTPARCFILGTKYFSGYYGCGRCLTHGSFKKNRTCFPEMSAELRTDDNFASKSQIEHHKSDSILITALNIKAITQVPLDSMHLVHLGVTKKIIFCLINGDLKVRLNSRQVSQINDSLMTARDTQPSDFSRRIRKISDYPLFKATEFRVFTLYTGMVVLKDKVPARIYEMFVMLTCGIRILSDSQEFEKNNMCAKNLLHDFLIDFGDLFGKYLISYNVHNIQHLADETLIQNSPLDKLATWEFESSNVKLKLFSRKPNLFLQQAYNRSMEKYNTQENKKISQKQCSNFSDSTNSNNNNSMKKNFITEVDLCGFKMNSSDKNKWFLTSDEEIWEFHSAFENENGMGIRGRQILKISDFFVTPIESSLLSIFKSDGKLSKPKNIKAIKIIKKMFCIKREDNEYVFIPLILF